ncbi:MAG: hypothetical protein WCB05_17615 [Candidatus Sulfotelmatobacter sp.]
MTSTRKCPNCGLDLTDTTASACPMCATGIVPRRSTKIWIVAVIQIAASSVFMVVFRFPKIMIVVFAGMIIIGTVLSSWAKTRPVPIPGPPKPFSHPILFRFASLGIAICALAIVCFLIFGSVIFLNSWMRWHLYEGQPYRRTNFQVAQVHFKRGKKGSVDLSANGTVEGSPERMNLSPYVHAPVHNEGELSLLVPAETIIPIYFFPNLKGRPRVQLDNGVPPAEEGHRAAIDAMQYGLLGLVVSAGVLFLLLRVRRYCYLES